MSTHLFYQPVHTPPDDILLAFCAGQINPAFGMVVSSHLYYSPISRKRVREMECLGGILLDKIPPAEIRAKSLDAVIEQLNTPLHPSAFDTEDDRRETHLDRSRSDNEQNGSGLLEGKLPPALLHVLGGDMEQLKWRRISGGVEEADIPGGKVGPCRARLMRIAPHTKVAAHTHGGTEMTLVLGGSYKDNTDTFYPGDLQICDASVHHQPHVDDAAPCLCLVASDAPVRLTGLLGRLINPFLRSA